MFIQQSFDQFLGLEYNRIDERRMEVRLNVIDLYINSAGVIHGGILSSLADVAMSNLVPADEKGQQRIVTVDLKVSFLRPAKGTQLVAKAQIINDGKRLLHAECQIFDDQENQVVQANGIFYRINPHNQSTVEANTTE